MRDCHRWFMKHIATTLQIEGNSVDIVGSDKNTYSSSWHASNSFRSRFTGCTLAKQFKKTVRKMTFKWKNLSFGLYLHFEHLFLSFLFFLSLPEKRKRAFYTVLLQRLDISLTIEVNITFRVLWLVGRTRDNFSYSPPSKDKMVACYVSWNVEEILKI